MPKLQNITEAFIKSAIDNSDEFLGALHDINNHMEKGYCDQLETPADLAKSLCHVASAASRTAALILAKGAMQEQKAELNALMRERAKLKSKED